MIAVALGAVETGCPRLGANRWVVRSMTLHAFADVGDQNSMGLVLVIGPAIVNFTRQSFRFFLEVAIVALGCGPVLLMVKTGVLQPGHRNSGRLHYVRRFRLPGMKLGALVF